MLGLMGEASRLTAYMRLCQCYYSSSYFDGLPQACIPLASCAHTFMRLARGNTNTSGLEHRNRTETTCVCCHFHLAFDSRQGGSWLTWMLALPPSEGVIQSGTPARVLRNPPFSLGHKGIRMGTPTIDPPVFV